jgi:hypothetical protein
VPSIPVQGVTPTPQLQACLSFANLHTTLYCMYFADGDPFDQPWGAVVGPCKTTGGNVYCGGGI